MSMDGMFVYALSKELASKLNDGRIDNVNQLNKTDFVLEIRKPGKTHNLYISVSYNNPTVFISPRKFEKPEVAQGFMMFLRKHLDGGIIKDIKQLNEDRIIEIRIEQMDELEGLKTKYIVVELIGRFSNLLILDENRYIIDAVKELSILESESRGIMKGLLYELPYANKLSRYNQNDINAIFSLNENLYSKKVVDCIMGISPFLANYLINQFKNSKQDFYTFFINEINKCSPVYCCHDYYYFDIFTDTNKTFYDDLSSLLFCHYEEEAEKKILKDNNQIVFKTVKSNLKRIERKLSKLNEELEDDKNCDDLRLKGELLLAYAHDSFEKSSQITVINYYNNEEITIAIDVSKSLMENSKQYFKRYKKSKSAIEHLNAQIKLAINEKEYFELLYYQLENASLKDILEIKRELIENQYLFSKENKTKKNKNKPNYLSFEFEDCKILVGKNNIQNNYITHTLALPNDLWFHIKDGSGSHVVVKGDNKYSEEVIRYAANLAAKYSSFSNSSSVPVDYTEVKFLKKVPGKKGSFVTYKKHKTIYIDPQ